MHESFMKSDKKRKCNRIVKLVFVILVACRVFAHSDLVESLSLVLCWLV
jgi:hypothetical protein